MLLSRNVQVGAADGLVAETQVGNGYAARFLGVVGEVALRVLIGVVADNLDAVLVRADGAVGAETVELAGNGGGVSHVDFLFDGERRVGDVVEDTNGEVVLLALVHILVYGVDHRRIEFLAAEAVSAAEHFRLDLEFVKSRDDVEVERFAEGTRFLGAVEHGDFLCGLGESGDEFFRGEGAVKTNLDHADLFAFGVEVIDGLFGGFCTAAHNDDDAVGVLCAVVIDEVILPARDGGDLVHHLLNDGGNRKVVLVGRFSVLEIDVGVLRRARLMGMFGVKRTGAETVDVGEVDEGFDFVVLDDVDFAHFVRGSEPVEETDERHGGFEGGQMRDKAHIHNFLHRVGSQHREARLTASHNVGVVAENAECVRRKCTGGDVEDAGKQFARNLVHIGNHQQKALAGGEGGGQRARGKRTVNGARRACFGLHFGYLEDIAENVLSALSRPLVAVFRHRRGRRYGVNRRNVGERICNVRRSGITVDCHLFHRDLRISFCVKVMPERAAKWIILSSKL